MVGHVPVPVVGFVPARVSSVSLLTILQQLRIVPVLPLSVVQVDVAVFAP